MKNLSVIDGSAQALPRVRLDAAEVKSHDSPTRTSPLPDSQPPVPAPPEEAPPAGISEANLPEIQSAMAELQESLDALEGPRREVQLHFEDGGEYVVEIRSIHDGEVIQRFPPENLLNLRGRSSDLLGTVIDRLS